MLQIENLLSELLQKEPEISAPAKALLEKIDIAGSEGWNRIVSRIKSEKALML